MPSNSFSVRVARFGSEFLQGRGFRPAGSFAFERPLDGFSQGIDFVKGTRSLEGKFTVNAYWRYEHGSYPSEGTMDCWQRIGIFDSGRDQWFPISHEESWERVGRIVSNYVEPFFARHETIQKIMESFEAGYLPPETLFGADKGWRAFNIGHCYAWLGKKDLAIKSLKEVVDEHSKSPWNWINRRKEAALATLAKLTDEAP